MQNPFKIKLDVSTDDEKWTVFSNALLVVDHGSLKGLLIWLKDIGDLTEMSNNSDDREVADLVRGLARDLVIASFEWGRVTRGCDCSCTTASAQVFLIHPYTHISISGVDMLKDAVTCAVNSRSPEQQATISMFANVLAIWKKVVSCSL